MKCDHSRRAHCIILSGSTEPSKEDLARMVIALRSPLRNVVTEKESLVETAQGVGAVQASNTTSGVKAFKKRSESKRKYQELLKKAKNNDSLKKVVDHGVDAKMPKQHFSSGSSK